MDLVHVSRFMASRARREGQWPVDSVIHSYDRRSGPKSYVWDPKLKR